MTCDQSTPITLLLQLLTTVSDASIAGLKNKQPGCIPHICHLLYTGRIFKFQILHLKITKIYPKTRKYVIFLRSIWKNLHLTEFFTRAAPVVPVTNMRYVIVIVTLMYNL